MHMKTTTAGVIERFFTTLGTEPLEAVQWEIRDAWPDNDQYFRAGVKVPEFWSQNALNVTSKLYLNETNGENIEDLIIRVSEKITFEGMDRGYFDVDQAATFCAELKHILVNQLAAFNSPVWFNIGRDDRPQQCSACYILGVEDSTTSIVETGEREVRIFKGGSGSGFNVSKIRGSMEELSTGGVASGPVSFMRMWDAGAGTFKSGGTTRRAAKLVRMDADHPDIMDFINCKVREEDRLEILARAGVDISMSEQGEKNVAEATSFQNANISVGVTNEFMESATNEAVDPTWELTARKTGEVVEKVSAQTILDEMAKAAWRCADPGIQFDTVMNDWHTTPAQGKITSSNPCGEYISNDFTSCNLSSINVLKFIDEDGSFDCDSFSHVVDVMITAMDILVDFSESPDEQITENTKAFRQLGIGYSNMGAAIMAQGYAYDSHDARDFAAAVTALETGRAYRQSALLAEKMGPFEHFESNRNSMGAVIGKHISALGMRDLDNRSDIWNYAITAWADAESLGAEYGYRNAQASVIAPAGSISYLMDCDTTGIEPAWGLVAHKDLAGGGSMTLVNQGVHRALKALGYSKIDRVMITDYIEELGEIPLDAVSDKHKAVFDGANEISAEGHIKMVAAVQPFVSGAISKTVNLPESATWEEMREMYILGWKLGCKDLALYRNNSKTRQVLMTKPKDVASPSVAIEETVEPIGPYRHRMPTDAQMLRHKFDVGGHEGYLMVGLYEDGSPGEIFLEDIGKEGSHLRGITNSWAIAISIGLQYGVPLETLIKKYSNMNFEPNGPTKEPAIPFARSLVDYVMRWMALKFLGPDMHEELGLMTQEMKKRKIAELDTREALASAVSFEDGEFNIDQDALTRNLIPLLGGMNIMSNGNGHSSNGHKKLADQIGPPCSDCSAIMQRAGACWTCPGCGQSTGCG